MSDYDIDVTLKKELEEAGLSTVSSTLKRQN
jgi:hypothetical protein